MSICWCCQLEKERKKSKYITTPLTIHSDHPHTPRPDTPTHLSPWHRTLKSNTWLKLQTNYISESRWSVYVDDVEMEDGIRPRVVAEASKSLSILHIYFGGEKWHLVFLFFFIVATAKLLKAQVTHRQNVKCCWKGQESI